MTLSADSRELQKGRYNRPFCLPMREIMDTPAGLFASVLIPHPSSLIPPSS